jgi:hypothetical protein
MTPLNSAQQVSLDFADDIVPHLVGRIIWIDSVGVVFWVTWTRMLAFIKGVVFFIPILLLKAVVKYNRTTPKSLAFCAGLYFSFAYCSCLKTCRRTL